MSLSIIKNNTNNPILRLLRKRSDTGNVLDAAIAVVVVDPEAGVQDTVERLVEVEVEAEAQVKTYNLKQVKVHNQIDAGATINDQARIKVSTEKVERKALVAYIQVVSTRIV